MAYAWLITLLLMAQVPLVWAETYQYTDENGTLSFTDNPSSIPKTARKPKKRSDAENPEESVTRFRLIKNHVIVSVVILYKGREARGEFVFDTGASNSVISPELAKKLMIEARDTSVAMMEGVGGKGIVGTVLLDAIKLDGKSAGNLEVSVVPFGDFDGLLGMDFLAGKKFQVDYDALRIRWL